MWQTRTRVSVAICSRKAQTAIVWDTAASCRIWICGRRRGSSRARWRGCAVSRLSGRWRIRRRICAGRMRHGLSLVLAFQSNRGTGPRATASGTVANPCNPAAPEASLWQSCRLLVRRKPVGRQLLLDNSAAAARRPSGSHWKTATKQSSWQEPELWRSRPKPRVPVPFDRPQIDRIRSPLTTTPVSP